MTFSRFQYVPVVREMVIYKHGDLIVERENRHETQNRGVGRPTGDDDDRKTFKFKRHSSDAATRERTMPPKKRAKGPLETSNGTVASASAPNQAAKKAAKVVDAVDEDARTFDSNGACAFPLEALLRENVELAKAYETLRRREREMEAIMGEFGPPGGDASPFISINGVEMDAPVESDAPGEPCGLHSECFWMFVMRLMGACCSGSTSGDAQRLSMVLQAALSDVKKAKKTWKKYFDKTLALTKAIDGSDFEIEIFIDRGFAPTAFFANLASLWREILSEDGRKNLKAAGVADKHVHNAETWCAALKQELESGGVKFDYAPKTTTTSKGKKR